MYKVDTDPLVKPAEESKYSISFVCLLCQSRAHYITCNAPRDMRQMR